MNTSLVFKLSLAALMLGSAACGGHKTFNYGELQPGAGKNWGGQLLLEHINHPEGPTARGEFWLVTRTSTAEKLVGGLPDTTPSFTPDTCTDLGPAPGTMYMPPPLTGGTKPIDVKNFKITSATGGTITLPRVDGSADAPTLSNDGISGEDMYVGPIDPNLVPNDTKFSLSFDSPAGSSADLHSADSYLPKNFDVHAPYAVGKQNVTFTKGQDLVLSWDANGDADADGFSATYPMPVIQLGPGDTTGRTFICPLVDGKLHTTFTVPASVVGQLDATGIVMVGKLTHALSEFKGARVDLLSVSCNTSTYRIE